MRLILDKVIYGGSNKLKDGKELLTFVEDGKVFKVKAEFVENGYPVGSSVSVEVDDIKSIFVNYGDYQINALSVKVGSLED